MRMLKRRNNKSRAGLCEGKTAASHGAQDWGSTYAEVDLTNQKMWYVKTESLMSADVVTGLPKGGRSTSGRSLYDFGTNAE